MVNMANPIFPKQPQQYHLPRILCLHGGGANAEVFRMQCRALTTMMYTQYRFVFIEGPAFCAPHEALVAVYGDFGPFRRWTSWLPEHRLRGIGPEAEWDECIYCIRSGMEADQREAEAALGEGVAVGPWVGLLGFSQGARIAASLLYARQVEHEKGEKSIAEWQWAVLMAGRGPLITAESLQKLAAEQEKGDEEHEESHEEDEEEEEELHEVSKVKLPTLHVHGMLDPGLLFHQLFLETHFEPGTTELVEWEGDHRVPIKSQVLKPIVDAITQLAKGR